MLWKSQTGFRRVSDIFCNLSLYLLLSVGVYHGPSCRHIHSAVNCSSLAQPHYLRNSLLVKNNTSVEIFISILRFLFFQERRIPMAVQHSSRSLPQDPSTWRSACATLNIRHPQRTRQPCFHRSQSSFTSSLLVSGRCPVQRAWLCRFFGVLGEYRFGHLPDIHH